MRRAQATLALILLLFLAAGCGEGQPPAAAPPEPPAATSATEAAPGSTTTAATDASSTLPTTTVTLTPSDGAGPVEVRAEVADDDAERQRGLMERDELADDAGMLFVFGREQQLSFWMRNTRVPLSIAYIAADGRIVDIEDMEPFDDRTQHPSAEPARYALEVNQGFFEERGIEVGDTVESAEMER